MAGRYGSGNVNNVIVTPVISSAAVTSHLTRCSPFNGEVTATATPAASYTFYWFNGNIGTPDTLASNFKGATYSGVNAGYYTVVAVNKFTRCASVRSVVQVLDNTTNPVLTTSSTSQTSCTAAAPNGTASANVGGTTTGYKFRWFAGADTLSFWYRRRVLQTALRVHIPLRVSIMLQSVLACARLLSATSLSTLTVTGTIVNTVQLFRSTPMSITLQDHGGAESVTGV